MITEDQVVALFAKLNPIPSLDDLDAVETFDTESLVSPRDRSSIVSNQKPTEKKVPVSGRRALVAALVIVVLAAVAVPLLLRGNGGRGVAALPTTTSVPAVTTEFTPWGGSDSGAHLTVMVPDGWSAYDGYVAKSNADNPPNWMAVGASYVANIYADSCHEAGALLDPPPGPTVDDLASAFAEVWGSNATIPTDVTLDGFAGKQMVLTVPIVFNFDDCAGGRFWAWRDSGGGDRWYQGPGQIQQLWIVDVEGSRLLVEASYLPETSPEDRAELQQVIDSIQIEP